MLGNLAVPPFLARAREGALSTGGAP
jgi:hypothetical protein